MAPSGVLLIPDFTVDAAGLIHGQPTMCLSPVHETMHNKRLVGSFCSECSLRVVGMYDSILKR